VNGPPGGALAPRAAAFAERLGGRFEISTTFRERGGRQGIGDFLATLSALRPAATYVIDMAYAGVLAAARWRRSSGAAYAIDTGDAIFALARSAGLRGPLGLAATWALEEFGLRDANAIVVRGTYHRELLSQRGVDATVVQDGVEAGRFASREVPHLRASLAPAGELTVGLLGNTVWSTRLGIGYGWELVEIMRELKGEAVRGIMIGSGTAIPILKERAASYGVSEQLTFIPHIPYDTIADYLSAIDICLSTQTNDVPGNVRTTGKLPLYLAAGRYILASDVGEAARVLPQSMRVRYDGTVDRAYPSRVAARVRELLSDRKALDVSEGMSAIARARFDYDVLAPRVGSVLDELIAASRAS